MPTEGVMVFVSGKTWMYIHIRVGHVRFICNCVGWGLSVREEGEFVAPQTWFSSLVAQKTLHVVRHILLV